MLINFNHLKTFYNALVHKMKAFRGNWNQNDPTADDYIKNRPFYSEEGLVEVLPEITVNVENAYESLYNPFEIELEDGKTYTVIFDGSIYTSIAKSTYENEPFIGNSSILGWNDNINTGEPFFIDVWNNSEVTFATTTPGKHTISVGYIDEIVHKLDKKYLPDIDIDTAIIDELGDRVESLESVSHFHSNKTVLDDISASNITSWNSAEQNAKTYAYNMNTAMNTRVKVLEAIDHDAYVDADTALKAEIIGAVNDATTSISIEEIDDICADMRGGLYQTGAIALYNSGDQEAFADMLITSWSDLCANGTIHVNDGHVYTNYNSELNENSSVLAGDLVLPNNASVTSIDKSAFRGCEGLTAVAIPDSVTSIDYYAFKDCTNLTSIVIPNSVKSINSDAFAGCSNIESITLPFVGQSAKTASDTGQYPFGHIFGRNSYTGGVATKQTYYYTTKVPSSDTYYIPEKLKSVTITGGNILYGAFDNCSGLTSIAIPDSVTNIGGYAFRGCTGLTSIVIPAAVTSINFDAFSGCSNLKTVYYEGILEQWCNITFGDSDANPCCNSGAVLYIDGKLVDNIVIPSMVTKINPYAFYWCTSLTSVEIPDGVTSIGKSAFHCCIGLTSIEIPDSVTSISNYAFYSCAGLTSVTIGSGVTSIDPAAFGWSSNLKTVYYKGTLEQWCNITFGSESSNPCGNGADLYIDDELINDIVIPSTVTEIKPHTFYHCKSLTGVEISEGVTNIGSNAFYSCAGLTSIEIPDGVTSIGDQAFYYCTGLTSITIPDSMTSIGKYAFCGCANLASITFTGTVEQWNAITLGTSWKYIVPATTVTCSDGTVTL